MAAVISILMGILNTLTYLLPVIGKLLEKQKGLRKVTAMLEVVSEAERLLVAYRASISDGQITAAEMDGLITQMQILVSKLRIVSGT